ncbi:hypothetical protein [Vogesella sp. EB]|uniref:hypothetical protein n=1 Tax=Vogesella sp. EB TaxID=1526735 RepID=UPI0012E05B02
MCRRGWRRQVPSACRHRAHRACSARWRRQNPAPCHSRAAWLGRSSRHPSCPWCR